MPKRGMPDVCIGAFKNGKLSQKPASTMAEIRARAQMYILEEDDDALKRLRENQVEKEIVPSQPPTRERSEGSRQR